MSALPWQAELALGVLLGALSNGAATHHEAQFISTRGRSAESAKKKGFKSFFLKWIEMLGCASVLSPRIFSNFPLLYLLRAAGAVVTRAGIMGEWVRGEFGNETHSLCFSSGFKGVSVFRLRQKGNRHSQTQAHIPADSFFQQCTGRAGRRGGAQGWGTARLWVRSPVLMGWSRAEL